MSFDIETKKNIDIVFFLNEIDNHQNKKYIINYHFIIFSSIKDLE